MKKRIRNIFVTVLIISLSLTLGCSKKFTDGEKVVKAEEDVKQNDQNNTEKENVEIELWSWFDFGGTVAAFEEQNKNINVKERVIPFDKCRDEYMKALASGEGPDVLVFDSSFFGQYTADNILQNLFEEPCDARKYWKDIIGWKSGLSIDDMELLSLSYSTAPYLTFYRADIMKENGFPYEPEEFGKFIEDPKNIMEIGKKLKQQNKYIFQYPTDITDIVGATMGYFDNELNYVREGELFAETIDMAQEIYDSNLMSQKNFWLDTGKKAIQEDQLVMLFLASYAMNDLERMAPEQKGKWRIAKAPLGIAAWASDTRLSINNQSEYKEEAWKLIVHAVTTVGSIDSVVPSYIPALENEDYLSKQHDFFGGQKIYPLLVDSAKNMTQFKLTPLDRETHDLYIKGMWQSFVQNDNAYAKIERMRKEIEQEIEDEKESLLE